MKKNLSLIKDYTKKNAQVAKLVGALCLERSVVRRAGSSPVLGTESMTLGKN